MPSLDSKIDRVMQGFRDLCSPPESPALQGEAGYPFAIAWTGGKDSTVTLHLWKTFLQEQQLLEHLGLVALSIDTGLKFPEVIAFRDRVASEWDVELHVASPGFQLQGYPIAEDPVACCKELKVVPLLQSVQKLGIQVLFTGLRRDEHPSRQGRQHAEQRDTPCYLQYNPILNWSEMDVWSYIMEKGLPYCELYTRGYRSLGCMPCTAAPGQETASGERGGRNQAKEGQLEQLRSLGYF